MLPDLKGSVRHDTTVCIRGEGSRSDRGGIEEGEGMNTDDGAKPNREDECMEETQAWQQQDLQGGKERNALASCFSGFSFTRTLRSPN